MQPAQLPKVTKCCATTTRFDPEAQNQMIERTLIIIGALATFYLVWARCIEKNGGTIL